MGLVRLRPNVWAAAWPEPFRWLYFRGLAWLCVSVMCSLYYILPLGLALLPLWMYFFPRATMVCALCSAVSLLLPMRQWPTTRCVGQMMYEIFDVHANLDDVPSADAPLSERYIYCQFPHGVIPITVAHWCAIVDQYFPERYGFGAISSVLQYMPIFRQARH